MKWFDYPVMIASGVAFSEAVGGRDLALAIQFGPR